jgi:hypothetical protein
MQQKTNSIISAGTIDSNDEGALPIKSAKYENYVTDRFDETGRNKSVRKQVMRANIS